MKLVLTRDVEKLGMRGEVVDVAPGYGRNYLLPRGFAVEATPANLREWESRREKIQRQVDAEKQEAQELVAKLTGAVLHIKAKAGDEGRLYGSVTAKDLSEALRNEFGLAIDRKRIVLPEPVKTLGAHPIKLSLHPDVEAELMIDVSPEEEAS